SQFLIASNTESTADFFLILLKSRGDMIAVGHSECEQYFVLFNILLCSSMFIDRDECKKHTHNASIVLFFRPQKMGVLFSLH
ncbi:hypothetical protein, partial [Staphylococcus aureus]